MKNIVCVCSSTVGSAANVLAHLAGSPSSEELKIILLSDNYATAPDVVYLERVLHYLEQLGTGHLNGKQVTLEPEDSERYLRASRALRNAIKTAERVYVRDLDARLREATKSISLAEVRVDVTCLPKPLAADVTVTCAFLQLRAYSFELIKPFDSRNPEASLYHSLTGDGFRYPCLTDPAVVAAGMRDFTSKKSLKVSVLAACIISVACFALLIWLKPGGSASSDVALWIGLVSGIIGIGTGIMQISDGNLHVTLKGERKPDRHQIRG